MPLSGLAPKLLMMIGTELLQDESYNSLDSLSRSCQRFHHVFGPQCNTLALQIHAPRFKGDQFFEVCKALLSRGASARWPTRKHTNTPLYHAVKISNLDAVRLLLSKGADPNAVVKYHSFALLPAVFMPGQNGEHEFTKTLLSYGADPNLGSDVDPLKIAFSSPLHVAVYRNDIPLVNLLLAAGANINVKNSELATPIFSAKTIEMMKLLLEKGADACVLNGDGESTVFWVRYTEAFLDWEPEKRAADYNGMVRMLEEKGAVYRGSLPGEVY